MDDRSWGDPTRRTHLANERTYLAWWRSGLTAFAVAVGVGRVIPDLTEHGGGFTTAAAGIGFAVLGLFFVVYGTYRVRAVERALEQNSFSHPSRWLLLGLALAGTALGGLTIAVVVEAF